MLVTDVYDFNVYSRFLDSEWVGQGNQIPRKEVPLVRLRCDQEGLELALEHDGVRSFIPLCKRSGA